MKKIIKSFLSLFRINRNIMEFKATPETVINNFSIRINRNIMEFKDNHNCWANCCNNELIET